MGKFTKFASPETPQPTGKVVHLYSVQFTTWYFCTQQWSTLRLEPSRLVPIWLSVCPSTGRSMFFKIENYGSGRAIREHGDLAVISVWCIRTECIHFYVIEG
jgi:hypothetical protein